MNKLTAESARQELTKLKVWENDGVLTLKEERYLQALEIALPILEQQERGEGEWIEWKGRECPVPAATPVEVKFRKGRVNRKEHAGSWGWLSDEDEPRPYDIIAYRIIPENSDEN